VTHFPEAKHVPWAYAQGLITASPSFELMREAFNFAKGRAKRLLPRLNGHTPHWNCRDEARMMQQDRDLAIGVERFVSSELFPADIFDARGVRAFVAEFGTTDRPGELSTLFAHLVGLSKACELFLGQGKIAVPEAADPARFGVATGA